jgi:hypothetical protein
MNLEEGVSDIEAPFLLPLFISRGGNLAWLWVKPVQASWAFVYIHPSQREALDRHNVENFHPSSPRHIDELIEA